MKEGILFSLLVIMLFGLIILSSGRFNSDPLTVNCKRTRSLMLIPCIPVLLSSCGFSGGSNNYAPCKRAIIPDQMSLVNEHYRDGKYLYCIEHDTIRVNVSDRQSSDFSYAIVDKNGKEIKHGCLKAKHWPLDKAWEELFVPLPAGLIAGEYLLEFYNGRISGNSSKENRRSYYPVILE